MNFTEFFTAYEKESLLFDQMMGKASIMFESIEHDHEINFQSAELKVLKESGTTEDLLFLFEAANKERENKFLKLITTLVDKAVAFFEKIIQWFKDLFTSENTKKKLDELDKAVKSDKNIANKKIQYTDYTKDIKKINKQLDEVEKDRRKVEAGIEPKESKVNKGLIIGGTVATVALGGAVALLTKITVDAHKSAKENKNILKDRRETLKKNIEKEDEVLRKIQKEGNETKELQQKGFLRIYTTKLTATEIDLRKQESECWKKTAMSLFSSIKSSLTGVFKKKDKDVDDRVIEVKGKDVKELNDIIESCLNDEYNLDEQLVTESFDVDMYIEAGLKDKFEDATGIDGDLAAEALKIAALVGVGFGVKKYLQSPNQVIKRLCAQYDVEIHNMKYYEKELKHLVEYRKSVKSMISLLKKRVVKKVENSNIGKLDELTSRLSSIDQEIKRYTEKISKCKEKLDDLEEKIQEAQEKIDEKNAKKQQRVNKIKNAFSMHKESSDDVDEYLTTLESELFGESDDVVEETTDEVDEYLTTLESELFGESDDVVEESYEYDILEDIFG